MLRAAIGSHCEQAVYYDTQPPGSPGKAATQLVAESTSADLALLGAPGWHSRCRQAGARVQDGVC